MRIEMNIQMNPKFTIQNRTFKRDLPGTTFAVETKRVTRRNSAATPSKNRSKFFSKSGAGFTLVETLVAISVLLLSIAGPLTIATRSLLSARFARDQVTAFYLAQEATELIRNQRDNNSIAGSPNWTDGLQACLDANGCTVDPIGGSFSVCPAEGCPLLYRHVTEGLYGYTTGANWEETRFTRSIYLTSVNPAEASVSITIAWDSGPLAKTFTIQENFLDW